MKKIALSGKQGEGKFALVDDDRFDELNQHKWHLSKKGYIIRNKFNKETGKNIHIIMHREVLGLTTSDKVQIDHVNRNPLDNQCSNLRQCNNIENCRNKGPSKFGISKYKGVILNKQGNWGAHISYNKKTIHLGTYKLEYHAALAYDRAAREYFKKFAYLNFPKVTDYSILEPVSKRFTSQYKGVSYVKRDKRWKADVWINGKSKHIGYFKSEKEAFQAREKFLNDMR